MKKDRSKLNRIENRIFMVLLRLSVILLLAIVISLLLYLVLRGLFKGANITNGFNINLEFLTTLTNNGGKTGGILGIVINTFFLITLVVLIASPIGVASAVYLSIYAKEGRFREFVKSFIEVLSGIPSIIFGLFGMLLFVGVFNLGYSLISGVLTLVLMILPTIIVASENAITSVDRSLIEASIGLGATWSETTFKVVLKAARSGIISGIILALGRAMGETAALIYTVGSKTEIATSLTSSSRPLSMHIYLGINEGQSLDKAFASSLVLIVMVLIINSISKKLLKYGDKK